STRAVASPGPVDRRGADTAGGVRWWLMGMAAAEGSGTGAGDAEAPLGFLSRGDAAGRSGRQAGVAGGDETSFRRRRADLSPGSGLVSRQPADRGPTRRNAGASQRPISGSRPNAGDRAAHHGRGETSTRSSDALGGPGQALADRKQTA